ncbi:LPXTG cell wall anchor domain-containing protein [Acidianus sp. RZ1]|nr:LPXTG cell wall anchor domain-containing protein [Acidianus sp. RZ1]NON61125.1 LPXTG cell wall anchor domain-containing protein [Acidianus sp. RZ1]
MFTEIFAAATYAPPSSIPFEDIFGFALAGIGIVAGILFYLVMRKKAI